MCDPGYEGEFCADPVSAKFEGRFDGIETCNSGVSNYLVVIDKDSLDPAKVRLFNLYNSGLLVEGSVDSTTLSIPSQALGNGTIQGNGLIGADLQSVTIDFSITIGPNSDACNLALSRTP